MTGNWTPYPFIVPDSVIKLAAGILNSALTIGDNLYNTQFFYQISIVDKLKDRKYLTKMRDFSLPVPTPILISWVPSSRVVCRIIVYRFGSPVGLSYAQRLDYFIDRKTGAVIFRNTASDVQRLIRKAQTSIRLKRERISRKSRLRRVRSSAPPRANPEQTSIQVPWYIYSNGNPHSTGNTTVPMYYREWNGVNTPNFARVKAMGKLPVNPHHVYMYTVRDYGYVFRSQWPTGAFMEIGAFTRLLGGAMAGPGIPSCNHLAIAENRAISKLIERSSGEVSNLAQDLVQMNQTTQIVSSTVKRLVGSITALKRFDFSGAVNNLWDANRRATFRKGGSLSRSKTLAENWLELQYGWKPLLQDIHGVIAGLQKLSLADRSVQTIYASATTKSTDNRVLGGIPDYPATGSYRCDTETRVKFSLRYRVDDHLRSFLAQTGFTNPVNLAWELLPYSFVVDWFLPIGPLLESFSSWDGLVFLDGSKTMFTRAKSFNRCFVVGKLYGVADQTEYFTGGYSTESVRLDRTKLTSFPSMSTPQFKNPVSTTHALNAMALLRAAFK
jgi:hypothetical protein